MIYMITLFLFWFLVWLFLSWPPDTEHAIIGIFVSLFVSLMTVDLLSGKERQKGRTALGLFSRVKRFLWFLYYIIVFVWECVKANFDVAYRVIHPDSPIRPGTVRVKTELRSDLALTFLANSLTLTPGRTTVDIDKERGFLYIHRLNLKEFPRGAEKSVEERFEKILKRIFE